MIFESDKCKICMWSNPSKVCLTCDFWEKEDVKMSKVTIEYEEVKRPVKRIVALSEIGQKIEFVQENNIMGIWMINEENKRYAVRALNKQTAIELVAALNELVKQL